jgi:mRNA interferase MazF
MSRRAPRRGEVWLAGLDPVEGAEMGKTRPVVVVSSDAMGVLPVKLVAPCTTARLGPAPWRVPLAPTDRNGLDRDTTIDLMQLRSISVQRLIRRLGAVDAETMEDVAAMTAAVVEYV